MTDEGVADAIYLEPLTPEVGEASYPARTPRRAASDPGRSDGTQLGGPGRGSRDLERYGVRLLGTPLSAIKQAEDRSLFRDLLNRIGEPVVDSAIVTSLDQAFQFAMNVPCRWSYDRPTRWAARAAVWQRPTRNWKASLLSGLNASPIHQVLLERSLVGWKEIEYEVMRDGPVPASPSATWKTWTRWGSHR